MQTCVSRPAKIRFTLRCVHIHTHTCMHEIVMHEVLNWGFNSTGQQLPRPQAAWGFCLFFPLHLPHPGLSMTLMTGRHSEHVCVPQHVSHVSSRVSSVLMFGSVSRSLWQMVFNLPRPSVLTLLHLFLPLISLSHSLPLSLSLS